MHKNTRKRITQAEKSLICTTWRFDGDCAVSHMEQHLGHFWIFGLDFEAIQLCDFTKLKFSRPPESVTKKQSEATMGPHVQRTKVHFAVKVSSKWINFQIANSNKSLEHAANFDSQLQVLKIKQLSKEILQLETNK